MGKETSKANVGQDNTLKYLIDLKKDTDDHLLRWVTLYVSIQSVLITAVAALLHWSPTQDPALRAGTILFFAIFAIVISFLLTNIMRRNRHWAKQFIEKAGSIFPKDSKPPGWNLSLSLGVVNWLVFAGWLCFVVFYFLNI